MGTFRTSEIFNDPTLTLIAVESVGLHQSKTKTGCLLYGNLEPIAVIVCSRDGACAIDMDAKIVDIEKLRQDIPELDAIIARRQGAKD